jgi:hypothetical protein
VGSKLKSTWHLISRMTGDSNFEMRIAGYLMVSLTRPWFNAVIFNTLGWSLLGQAPGFCSSGSAVINTGVLPMVPTGVILGTEIQINASVWAAADSRCASGWCASGTGAVPGTANISATLGACDWVDQRTDPPLSPQQRLILWAPQRDARRVARPVVKSDEVSVVILQHQHHTAGVSCGKGELRATGWVPERPCMT